MSLQLFLKAFEEPGNILMSRIVMSRLLAEVLSTLSPRYPLYGAIIFFGVNCLLLIGATQALMGPLVSLGFS